MPTETPTDKKKPQQHNSLREGVETVVFVVVLVFLLKQFVVEAFVIPTGSMAETLYGYQKNITCPECGTDFPLNSSNEVEPQPQPNGLPGATRPIEGYCCPNCRFKTRFGPQNPSPYNGSGDRVLVHKAMQHLDPPKPGDVVVFKFPADPQKLFSAQNYIKRMWGVGGDTVAIWRGDLYVCKTLKHPAPEDVRPEDLWQRQYAHPSDEAALAKFAESRAAGFPVGVGGFELVRKSDELVTAMRRLVYDNDKQSKTLVEKGVRPRWETETADWTPDAPAGPKVFTHAGAGLGWLRYKHRPVTDWGTLNGRTPAVPEIPVDNFLGYNAETDGRGFIRDNGAEDYRFWVGDLIVECKAKFADAAAAVTLELSKGANRFQAKFADGKVTLTRTGPGGKELGSWPTGVSGGSHDLRFANVDCRLRVWVDGKRIDLGPAADYDPTAPEKFDAGDDKKEGWTAANDVAAPASVGAAGGVEVSRLKLYRDTYYINSHYSMTSDATSTVNTYYVQPGHFLCLGDNSAQSSDGRDWGTVPERLMLGRAVFVFFPLDRIGFIK